MSSTDRPFDLIATDLDGTLLRSDHTVSERTQRALARAAEAGAAHIVVTGRSAAWTRPTLDAIGYQGLAVCGQGAQVYDSSRHQLLTSITLDREVARVALAKIEAMVGDVALAASRDGVDGEVLTGPGYRILGDALDCVPVTAPEEFWARPISRLFIQHPSLGDDELADAARQSTGGLVDVVVSGAGFVEILPVGLTKAAGLRLAASRLGLSARRAIAFGDMPNDVPMFRWAGHGVAMADAHPELKAVADEVTLSNDADGVAVVLERLFG